MRSSIRRLVFGSHTSLAITSVLVAFTLVSGQSEQDKINKDLAWANVDSLRVNWRRDQADSDQILVNSLPVRIISSHNAIDATVAMAFIDQGDYFAAYVYVSNDGQERLDVNPQDFRIAYWKNRDVYLAGKPGDWSYSVAPEVVASKYKNRAEWRAFFVRFAGGMATTTATTETSGTVTLRDGGGVTNGTYSSTSTMTVPDRRAQVTAEVNARRIINDAQGDASSLLSTALKGNTVFPGQHISGWVFFQRKKIGVGDVMLRITKTGPVGAQGDDLDAFLTGQKPAASPSSSGQRVVDYCFLTGPRK